MNSSNLEFIRLMRAAGWSQAETARRLGITSGAVNQFVKGSSRPSPTTLRLMELLVVSEHPERMDYEESAEGQLKGLRVGGKKASTNLSPTPDWETRIIDLLAPLAEKDRNRIISLIESMAACLTSRKDEDPKRNKSS